MLISKLKPNPDMVYMMDIMPNYCQMTIDRMLKLDPTLEIKKNGEPYVINTESTPSNG